MLVILDCNNFWSPSGGGVRRYHLEKMEYFKSRDDVKYVFVMHDSKTYTEKISTHATIEHIKVPKVIGNWEYRYLFKKAPLEAVILKHKPDVIEIGSPYILPSLVNKIVSRNKLKVKVLGFWHADFPVTYVGRFLKNKIFDLQHFGERIAWKFARKNYNRMDGVLVASKAIAKRMSENGIQNIHYAPLGVNHQLFNPKKRDVKLVKELKAGNPDRLILFFPHRFSKEKGLHILLEAYKLLTAQLEVEPALVLAGTGPYEYLVEQAVKKHEHVHFIGFVQSKEEMAKYYASADLGFALSKWETFGLSLVEAMSSGLPLISASEGAAPEHIIESEAGIVLDEVTPHHLAQAIVQFHSSDHSIWGAMARSYAEKLTWSQCFNNQLDIIKNRLDNN